MYNFDLYSFYRKYVESVASFLVVLLILCALYVLFGIGLNVLGLVISGIFILLFIFSAAYCFVRFVQYLKTRRD